MQFVEFSKSGTTTLFSHYYSSFMYPGTDFLLKPVFVRGLSASLHLVLLLVMFISWLCKKFKVVNSDGPSQKLKKTRNGWSIEELVTLLDLALKTLAWWGLYLFTSCYGLVMDVVLYRKHVNLPVHYFGSDGVSVVMGLFFCYVGLVGKNEGIGSLNEPLWIVDSNAMASYVGPYLIYTFVQYLNGQREFSQNEGYVLVSIFSIAKLVECLTKKHKSFRVQL
uniref:Uncharacterized protein n=1 Tax=Quercus lobata TaxID=97700 RepID=A0A7N2M885_QUELO